MPIWIILCIVGAVIIIVLQVLPFVLNRRKKDKDD